MAQRLSHDERARVEAMITAGVSVAEAARRLERDPSTIHRELALNRGGAGYDAEAAHAAAAARARRPKTPKLAADPVLADSVSALLAHRMSPHAICALLRCEGARGSAETIYRACYDHSGRRGLPEGVGAHNSVVGAAQGFRAPSWDQESVRDSVHEDSASAPLAAVGARNPVVAVGAAHLVGGATR